MHLALTAALLIAAPPSHSLSGEWVISEGEQPEPAAGAVHRPDPCWGANTVWTLIQDGDKVAAALTPGYFQGGAQPSVVVTRFDYASGTVSEGRLVLNGMAGSYTRYLHGPAPGQDNKGTAEPVTYSLTYDTKTQHLVGMRAGKKFWAAPLVREARKECGPPPP
jgi:hypothetical protein